MTDLHALAASRFVVRAFADGELFIPCDGGRLTAAPGDRLTVHLDRDSLAARLLRQRPGVATESIDRYEVTFVFPAANFDTLAPILRPRRVSASPLRSRFPMGACR